MNIKFYIFIIIVCLFFSCKNSNQNITNDSTKESLNLINIEKSDYGLIFTNIQINGKKIKAMIDFGDPHILQISSEFVKNEKIQVIKTDAIAKDLFGNTFEINEGIAKEVIIGDWKNINLKFSSSPNEMELVSEEINIKFEAVVGWGYFSQYYTTIDYKSNKFELSKNKPNNENILFRTMYDKNSNYLSIPVVINASKENLIIDTGSPLSVIDSSYYYKNELNDLSFKLGNKDILIDNPHIQNLEMLKQLNAIGIIGGDFLGKYKITIDPFENKLSFKH